MRAKVHESLMFILELGRSVCHLHMRALKSYHASSLASVHLLTFLQE